MTPTASRLLAHITGTREECPEPGRNSLVAAASHPGLAELIEAGLVEPRGFWSIAQEYVWAATPAGEQAAQDAVRARREEYRRRVPLRRRQAKAVYGAWLALEGALSFGDFLRSSFYAEYRAEARRGAQ